MSHEYVSPVAARIIAKCGGARSVADLTGTELSAVYRWTHAKSKRGTGGEVPTLARQKLIAAAVAGSVPLEVADFVDWPATGSIEGTV